MTRMLALGYRIPPLRWVLGRMHWPRPHDFDRMERRDFDAFTEAIGFDAAISASLAELHGGSGHPRRSESGLRATQAGVDQARNSPVAGAR